MIISKKITKMDYIYTNSTLKFHKLFQRMFVYRKPIKILHGKKFGRTDIRKNSLINHVNLIYYIVHVKLIV